MHAGQVRVVFEFSIVDDVVVAIDLLSDADTLAQLQLDMLVR